MAQKSVPKIEVPRVVFAFIATLSVLTVPAVLAQSPGTHANKPLFLPERTYNWDGGRPQNLMFVDVNGDKKPDLLISGIAIDNTGTIGVLLGNGDGTFQEPSAYYDTAGQAASLPVVTDVNGDGKPDLVVAESCAGWLGNCTSGDTLVGVVLGNGDGTFQPAVVYKAGGSAVSSVAVGDLNGDGKPDLVVGDLRCTSTGFEGCVSVLLGNGDGTFQTARVYDAGGWDTDSVVLADVNGDRKLDILVANGGGTSSIGILVGNGDGSFQSAVTYGSGGNFALDLAVADVNRDGIPDLLVTNVYSNTIGVLLGNGDGSFRTAMAYGSGGQGIVSVVAADLSNDGKLDVALANCGTQFGFCPGNGSVGVLLGRGDGTFGTAMAYDAGSAPEDLAVADLNLDGDPDLVVAMFDSGLLSVLQGRGDGTFQPAVLYDSGIFRLPGIYPAHAVQAWDLNGDDKPDLVVIGTDATGRGKVGVLLNNTAFCTAPPLITLSASPTSEWPPNGKIVPVTVTGTITDDSTGCTVATAAYAVKDEYGEVQPSGPVRSDAAGAYSFTVLLQASRLGSDSDGRVYTITVSATNNAGTTGSHAGKVVVSHDQAH